MLCCVNLGISGPEWCGHVTDYITPFGSGSIRNPPGKLRGMEITIDTPKIRNVLTEVKENIAKENKPKKPRTDVMLNDIEPQATPFKDYSCFLTQVNLDQEEEDPIKFHFMQVAEKKNKSFMCYSRWTNNHCVLGRHQIYDTSYEDGAVSAFKTKFKTNTKNDWDNRNNFLIQNGHHGYVETDEEPDLRENVNIDDLISFEELEPSENGCGLPYKTQVMIAQLTYSDLFYQWASQFKEVYSWQDFKISKAQLIRGLEALLNIEEAIKNNKPHQVLMDLSANYYALLPSPRECKCIETIEELQKKIETILYMTKIDSGQLTKVNRAYPSLHPLQEAYQMLNCDLELLVKSESEFKLLEEYSTSSYWNSCGLNTWTLLDVWRVDCKEERERKFKSDNNMLLWYPLKLHDLARVLSLGINRETSKIFFSTKCSPEQFDGDHMFGDERNIGFISLAEVAIGKECHAPYFPFIEEVPEGYDTLKRGKGMMPDSNKSKTIKLDGQDVMIPVWRNITDEYNTSPCYFVSDVNQVKLRYLLRLKENVQ